MTPGFFFSISLRSSSDTASGSRPRFELKATHQKWIRTELNPATKVLSVLIGRIHGDLGPAEAISRVRAGDKNIFGRYLLVEWNPHRQQLWACPDPYRRVPALWINKPNHFLLSNCEQDLYREAEGSFSSENMLAFVMGGYLPPGYHFLREFRWLRGPLKLELNAGKIDEQWVWGRERSSLSSSKSEDEILSSLSDAVNRVMTDYSPNEFRVSGGLDTRLIGLLLTREQRDQLNFVTVCHPNLAPIQDADVTAAQQLCIVLERPLTVLRPTHPRYFFFVDAPVDSATLSGFYGGEFLGGTMTGELPKYSDQFVQWLKSNWGLPHSLWAEAQEIVDNDRARCTEIGLQKWASELFLQSDRSTIYDSYFRSWASPIRNNYVALTPYTEDPFLDVWHGIEPSRLTDYALYANLYRKVAGAKINLPLASQACLYHADLPPLTNQTNPKSIPRRIGGPSEEQIKRLVEIFADARLPLSEEQLKYFLDSPQSKIRFLNLSCWFRDHNFYRKRILEKSELASQGDVALSM